MSCPNCNGRGYNYEDVGYEPIPEGEPITEIVKCEYCQGIGKIEEIK